MKYALAVPIRQGHPIRQERVKETFRCAKADLILILCDHNEFKKLDYELILKNMSNPIVFDTKNIIKEVPSEIKLFNYGNLYELN